MLNLIAELRERERLTVIVVEHKVKALASFHPRWIAMEGGQIAYDGDRLASVPAPEGAIARWPRARARTLAAQPLVEVERLLIDYGGAPVLRDLSLRVRGGEFVALMGDNGSGKTTLLRCLMGLAQPESGRVAVCGRDTRETPVAELAVEAGYVFQNPDHQLFCDSVWQEAAFAAQNLGLLDAGREAEIAALLERCGLGDRHDEHPYRLSYGEKRRLNLVSALGHDPSLILLDEPLIGQDPANVGFLMEWLGERVARGAAVVMVNHDPGVTQRSASRLVFLARGQTLVDAPTREGFAQLAELGREVYVPEGSGP
jgi:energy-coupling factor transport system ATP-binding protein